MCSEFNSSSSLMVLPKCNFLSSRPILDFQDGCLNSPPQDTQEAQQLAQNQEDDHRQQDTQQEENNKKEEGEESEDVKDYNSAKQIPTSPEPSVTSTRQMMICPPAPKKKKAIQVTKRKHDDQENVFLDVYDEVESMFPPALLADLGNKIKKARKKLLPLYEYVSN
ncbi:hypothetical protein HAX54_032489 [Datura stramonium]|uniref:BESS domain-containing protein n=1 Tax=Datura stramonium TaxID=4076 RepID=A0ABS8VCU6_DATST|nr:hypothetical protein [Datura stramonium]